MRLTSLILLHATVLSVAASALLITSTSAGARVESRGAATDLPSCVDSYVEANQQAERAACSKPWLVLIHMAADNDLHPYALLDLYELQSIGSTLNVDVVIQLDLPGRTGIQRLLIRKSPEEFDPRVTLREIQGRSLDSFAYRHLKTLPEPSLLTEERKLHSFITESSRSFPSRHTLIITWGHGKGWTALNQTEWASRSQSRNGGVGFSESTGAFLGIPALKRALLQSSDEVRDGKPWDLFISDACLMQMAEIVTELSGTAEILMGSSQNQDYLGLPYRKLLQLLNSVHSPSPEEVASDLPELMKSFLKKASSNRGASTNQLDMGMSAIRTSEWTRYFLPVFRSVITRLKEELQADDMLRIRLKPVLRQVPRFENGGVELGSLLRLLENALSAEGYRVDGPLRRELSAAARALDAAVLAYSFSSPEIVTGKRSVSLWAPYLSEEFRRREEDFARSELHRSSDLGELLALLVR